MIHPYLQSFTSILNTTKVSGPEGHSLDDHSGFAQVIQKMILLRDQRKTVYLIGNGGSSGIISHAAIDLLNKGHFKAFPLTDNSMLTCLANDYGYENVFRTVLEKTATAGDILIAVSSSGKSSSILNAVQWARENDLYIVTYSGFDPENPLRSSGHVNFWLDSSDYGKVETGHALLLHILSDALWFKS